MRTRLLPGLLLASLLLPAGARATDDDLAAFAWRQQPGTALPLDTALRDEAGRDVTLGQPSPGPPMILALGYFHCPALCGVVRADLFRRAGERSCAGPGLPACRALDRPGGDRRRCRPRQGGRPRACRADGRRRTGTILTGPAPSVAAVAGAVGFRSRFDPQLKQFLHPAGVVVLTPARRGVSSYLLGVGYSGRATCARRCCAPAPAGWRRLHCPMLLLCFHYDPAHRPLHARDREGASALASADRADAGRAAVRPAPRRRPADEACSPQPSSTSREIDWLILRSAGISLLVLGLVFGMMFVSCIRYRHDSKLDRGKMAQKTWRIETAWTAATLVALLRPVHLGRGPVRADFMQPPATR